MKFSVKKILTILVISLLFYTFVSVSGKNMTPISDLAIQDTAIIADHSIMNAVRNDLVPDSAIVTAKNDLHIAYAHTSHGSQIVDGMSGLSIFKESTGGTEELYDWNEGGSGGALDLDDYFVSGDLGNPDRTTWASETQDYLEQSSNSDVNVVMWSWCGQVSGATEENIDTYLGLMCSLEVEFSNISFVYMTGHVDGSGLEGNLHLRNTQIRNFCAANNKILFDFADIESYDPDGNYYGDKYVLDTCEYDTNNDTNPWGDGNWATEWQAANPGEWYDCGSAHSEPLNANQKAYAIWWLWAILAGWDDPNVIPTPTTPTPYPTPEYTIPLSIFSTFFGIGAVFTFSLSIALLTKKRKK